ncbi:FAD-dependent oxidoreductase [Actinosynnema sp. CS-041913]|uniref:FAD-dependent oxidoreductase n=1 Tax=Actinosynnema sp. CS-041913 TaxID=3239917 RepID=UPI003D8CDF19
MAPNWCATTPSSGWTWPPAWCAGPARLRPDGAGRLLLHDERMDGAAQVSASGEVGVEPAAVGAVLAAARALYPGVGAATVESVRVGERPIPADGLPVLGRAAEVPNLVPDVSRQDAGIIAEASSVSGSGN